MFSIKSISLCLLVFYLSLHVANCDSPYLFHFCFNNQDYASSSPYQAKLDKLFGLLFTKAPGSGFGLATVGQGEEHISGLALCRGDVSSTDCQSCITTARKGLQKRCPNKKGAVIWYDYCLLKYSNDFFFGDIDNNNRFAMLNVFGVDDPATLNGKVNELLSSLSYKASQTEKLYAIGELKLKESETLYGLAQCTKDLIASRCKTCLDQAISQLPNCCSGKRGGRVVGGSCYVRYELYPIVQA